MNRDIREAITCHDTEAGFGQVTAVAEPSLHALRTITDGPDGDRSPQRHHSRGPVKWGVTTASKLGAFFQRTEQVHNPLRSGKMQ